jgi:O-antigen ligase/tetratricopeptide (TPR) repeat protein
VIRPGVSPNIEGRPLHNCIVWGVLFLHLTLSPLLFCRTTIEVFEENKVGLLQAVALVLVGLSLSAFRLPPRPWRLQFDPITLGFVLFTISALVSTVCSISPRVSWRGSAENRAGAITILSSLVLYLSTQLVCRDVRDGRRLLAAVVFAAAVTSTYALVQHAHADPVPWSGLSLFAGQIRPFGTLGHSNSLAAYLVMAWPLVGAYLLWPLHGSRWARSLLALLGVLILSVVVLTLSRAAWLAGSCVIGLTLGVACAGASRERQIRAGLVLAGVMVLAAVWFFGSGAGVRSRITNLIDSEGRKDIWSVAGQLFLDRPLCGWGTDCFRLAFGVHRPVSFEQTEGEGTPSKAHNELLHVLATQGLLGGAAVALLAFGLVRGSLRAWRVAQPDHRPFVLGVAASTLAFAVVNLFGFPVAGISTLFVTCAALLSRWSADEPRSDVAPASRPWSVPAGFLVCAVLSIAIFECNLGVTHLLLALGITTAGALAGVAVCRLESTVAGESTVRSVAASSRRLSRCVLIGRLALATVVAELLVVNIVRPFQASQACWKGEQEMAEAPARALRFLEESTTLDPGNDRAWSRLSEAAQRMARQTDSVVEQQHFWQLARDALERACAVVPADAYHRASLARLLGELALAGTVPPESALEAWRKTLSVDPRNLRFLLEAGRTALGVGDLVQARQYLTLGSSLYPAYPDFLALLGACFLADGKASDAVPYLERALRGNWHADADGWSRAVATMTALQLQLGHPSQALELAEMLVDKQPCWPLTWVLLGRSEAAMRHPSLARDAYQRALVLDPHYPGAVEGLRRLNAQE